MTQQKIKDLKQSLNCFGGRLMQINNWLISASAALYLHSLAVSHSSLSHSRSAAPEVVVSSGRTTFCYRNVVRMHSPVDSHSSLSHSRSAAPDVVASSGRTIVREKCMELYEVEMPQG